MRRIRPIGDKVVVKRDPPKDKTDGGLHIPETAQKRHITGEVLAIGPGTVNKKGIHRPVGVSIGDVVLFGGWTGTEVDVDGETYVVLKEDDIMGTVDR